MRRFFLVLFALIILCCSACSTGLKYDTTEKIETLYLENKELFSCVAYTLAKYDEERHVQITREKGETNADIYVVKAYNGLYIEASDALTVEDFQAIYEACAPLFAALEERGLLSGLGKFGPIIEFMIEGPIYGNAVELFYFSDAEYGSFYMTQTKGNLQIDPHWYAEICYY